MNEKSLRQKIWMIGAILNTFSALPKIGKSEELKATCGLHAEAKQLFEEGKFEDAAPKAAETLESLKGNCSLLPKRARKVVLGQLGKIAKYG